MFLIQEESHDMLPQERLEQMGERTLSNTELLAVILRTGTKSENIFHLAQRVFDTFENLHDFKMASLEELQSIPGVGRVKSAQIKAMLELGRRIHLVNQQFGEKITSSYGVAQTLIEQMKDYKQEHLVVIYLNAQNAIIRQKTMFIGTLNSSIAHPREIYRDAVKFSASSLIIAHNHPSSDTKPSSSDVELTKQMQKAGQYLGIPLIDHLIIGHDDYYSFRENDKL